MKHWSRPSRRQTTHGLYTLSPTTHLPRSICVFGNLVPDAEHESPVARGAGPAAPGERRTAEGIGQEVPARPLRDISDDKIWHSSWDMDRDISICV